MDADEFDWERTFLREKLGKVKEQLRSKDVAEKVKQRIDEVPRPDKPDVVDKLRDGKF